MFFRDFTMNMVQVNTVIRKMEAAHSSQTFQQTHYTTRHKKQDDNLNNTRHKTLQTYIDRLFHLFNTAMRAHALSHRPISVSLVQSASSDSCPFINRVFNSGIR